MSTCPEESQEYSLEMRVMGEPFASVPHVKRKEPMADGPPAGQAEGSPRPSYTPFAISSPTSTRDELLLQENDEAVNFPADPMAMISDMAPDAFFSYFLRKDFSVFRPTQRP